MGGCGYGAITPVMQSLVFKCVPRKFRGAGSNTTYFGQDFGYLIGSYIGGFAIDLIAHSTGSELIGYSNMWLVMLVPLAIATAVIIYWNVKRARE